MIRLKHIPTYDTLNDYYGDPDIEPGVPDPEYAMECFVRLPLPYPMKLSWDSNTHVNVMFIHRSLADAVFDALDEIKKYKGESYLMSRGYNSFGGAYNYRLMRGGTKLSTHAWCALDINPHLGPYRKRDKNGNWINRQPKFITDAFLKRGFTTFLWDRMHFQAVLSLSGGAVYYQETIDEINEG